MFKAKHVLALLLVAVMVAFLPVVSFAQDGGNVTVGELLADSGLDTWSEGFVVVAMGVLLVVVIALVWLVSTVIPKLHESVSGSNLAPLYSALLPLAKETSVAAYDTVIAQLRARVAVTPNTIDDELLAQIERIVAQAVAREIEVRSGGERTQIEDASSI